LRRTASFDVLSVKIGLTDSPVAYKRVQEPESVVNFEQEGVYIYLYGEQNALCGLSPIFDGRRPQRNHII